MDWISKCVATRLGGSQFEQQVPYKFETIKQLKNKYLQSPILPLLDLGIGEPDGTAPTCAIETLQYACTLQAYGKYADNGADFFKSSIVEYLQTIFNVSRIDTEQILPVLGIKSGLCLLAGTLINPGDLVACTIPGYNVFSTQTRYLGGEVHPLPLTPDNHFLPDFSVIPETIKHRIKVICLNYPNNPTGAIANLTFYQNLIKMALHYHWIILQDAAYSALSFQEPISILQIPDAEKCCVELHSMSKGFNMTGWRLGWLCGNKTIIKACSMYKNNCDSGQFLAIQKAASVALKHASMWLPKLHNKYKQRLCKLYRILTQHHFTPFNSQAGFFLYAQSPHKAIKTSTDQTFTFSNAFAFSQWLLQNLGIVTVPWDDCGAYLRFSVTFSSENEEDFFADLDQRLGHYQFQ